MEPSYSFFGTVCEKETLSTKSVRAFFCCTAEVFTTRDEDVRETLHQTSAAADLFRSTWFLRKYRASVHRGMLESARGGGDEKITVSSQMY